MKPTNSVIPVAFLYLSFNMISCEPAETLPDELIPIETVNSDVLFKTLTFASDPTVVTEDEKKDLYFMREEEKLARDVYVFFYTKFNVRTFGNITKSENQHSAAVLKLINYFGLTDPAVEAAGAFTNLELQKLYDKFTTEAVNVVDALKTGALIE